MKKNLLIMACVTSIFFFSANISAENNKELEIGEHSFNSLIQNEGFSYYKSHVFYKEATYPSLKINKTYADSLSKAQRYRKKLIVKMAVKGVKKRQVKYLGSVLREEKRDDGQPDNSYLVGFKDDSRHYIYSLKNCTSDTKASEVRCSHVAFFGIVEKEKEAKLLKLIAEAKKKS